VPLRVVFAEDNYLVREGIAALLSTSTEVEVVATVADSRDVLPAVAETAPDAVLTDIRMPPSYTTEGIDIARQIRADHPNVGVLVLSSHAEGAYAVELLGGGAAGLGYLLKERVANVTELVRALTEVSRGGSVLDPKVVEGLLATTARQQASPLARLTERETDVLREMAIGRSNAAIARALYLSERAVEKHINAVFAKLGLTAEKESHRRVRAVLLFLQNSG
jgi:DNA-binding NarL/FixJ family response regulator